MRFWHSKPQHLSKLREFEQLAQDYALDLRWPNKEKAPWHVVATVGRYGRHPQIVQFWPHLLKAFWDIGGRCAVGSKEVMALIEEATDYAYAGDIDLVEDDDAQTVP